MKKILFIVNLIAFIGAGECLAQGQLVSRNVLLSFFSSAPIEDIKAETKTGYSILDLQTNNIYFKVDIRSFKFRKGLMQEHFNENYMESDKYPYAEFKGKIKEPVDFSKDGTYDVTVIGDLLLHNVKQNYSAKAVLSIKNGNISGSSNFPVKLVDHNIKIPTLLIKNIAEVVQVTVNVTYENTLAKKM
ncbi:YceI family protein [Solitalea sp. MAHUQ-68]|uniref:YceI family protein n=1 Tax=Solitalea agri TaxID=2953739 RepID=A0A9X2F7W6_9SPHI|nr:YceI family protein [Solitalea agri]MCO4293358.1 YceI family protein [Solitalea agri]